MNAYRPIRRTAAVLLGLAWCWSLLKVAVQPAQAGPVVQGIAVGGWTLGLLPVHAESGQRRAPRPAYVRRVTVTVPDGCTVCPLPTPRDPGSRSAASRDSAPRVFATPASVSPAPGPSGPVVGGPAVRGPAGRRSVRRRQLVGATAVSALPGGMSPRRRGGHPVSGTGAGPDPGYEAGSDAGAGPRWQDGHQ